MGQRTSWDVAVGQSQVAGVKHDVIYSQAPSFGFGYCLVYRQIWVTYHCGSVSDQETCSEMGIESKLRSNTDVTALKNSDIVQKLATICLKLILV